MADGAWTEYTINITNATTSTQIKFEGYQASKARFFLDEVKITQASSSDPGDTKTNPELAYGVREYNATIGQDNAFPALTHADGVTGIVYSSSEESVATVDKDGNVTLKGIEGSTTIKASIKDNETWKDAEASYTLNVSKPSANLAYSASSCTVIVGEAAELPTLTYTEGVTGIVYASSNTDVATVNATTGEVTLTGAKGTTVISATLTGHATFADGSASYTLTVTDKLLAQTVDKLTADKFAATSTGYVPFSNVKDNSSAVYAGNSANNSDAIQLRGKENSGIVTTASGGKVTKVVLTWASGATKDRTVDVYGKSTAYSTAADLYSSSETTKGKCIGSMTYDGSATITTLNITEDYEFIGIRSKSNALQLNSVEITWASSGGSEETTKKDPNLAYSASSCTVIVGETPELPTLSYADGVTGIVYASTNTEVATVNETTGAVTLTGAEGTTVISATLEDNATFANGSASYTLTVTKTNTYRYKKVTATEELMNGGQYIIVCEELKLAKGPGSEYGSVEVNIDKGMIVPTESAAFGVYTLEATVGGYAFKFGNEYLCSAGADETGFSTSTTAVAWTVTIGENGNASIKCSNSPKRQILFSGTNFKNYASTNVGNGYYNVQLYQKVYPLTVSSATGGYATFYNEEEAYQMPEGLTGYAVTKAENGHFITRTSAYEAGATVPAKTPLLIIGEANSYYPAVVSGTGVEAYAGSNLLEGKRDANGNTRSAKDGSVYYYKLGLNAEKQPGFYWGAVGGAAFQMKKATTAYLAVPKKLVEGANALFFDFGGETGINEIQTEQADKAIFDLSGRRVQKATKGFYIVGGKKVLVK